MNFILKGTLITKYLVSYPIGWPNFRSTKMSLLETIGKDEGLDLIKGLFHIWRVQNICVCYKKRLLYHKKTFNLGHS